MKLFLGFVATAMLVWTFHVVFLLPSVLRDPDPTSFWQYLAVGVGATFTVAVAILVGIFALLRRRVSYS